MRKYINVYALMRPGGVDKNESKDHNGLHWLQTEKLSFNEVQEKWSGQIGNEEVLSVLS